GRFSDFLAQQAGQLGNHLGPRVFRRTAMQVVTLDGQLPFALVADEAGAMALGVQSDMLGEALDNGHPDDVRRQHQGAMLAEGEVSSSDQGMMPDTGNAAQ